MELELYCFTKTLLSKLCDEYKELLNLTYSINEKIYSLADFFIHKPNIATMRFLLTHNDIKDKLGKDFNSIKYEILTPLIVLKDIRNNCVHGKIPSLEETKAFRNIILGIEKPSILTSIILHKERSGLFYNQESSRNFKT